MAPKRAPSLLNIRDRRGDVTAPFWLGELENEDGDLPGGKQWRWFRMRFGAWTKEEKKTI